MNKHSNKLLIIQIIVTYVAMLPSFIGALINGEADSLPWIASILRSAEVFVLPLMLMPTFGIVSIIFSFIPSKEKVKSPILMSLIAEGLTIVWSVLVFVVLFKVLVVNPTNDPSYGLGAAIAVVFLTVLSAALLLPLCIFMIVPTKLHAITYSIHNIRNGTFDQNVFLIIGIILLFFMPLLGQIIVYSYEKSHEKEKAEAEKIEQIEQTNQFANDEAEYFGK